MLFQIILIAADLLKADVWCGLWSSTATFIQLFLPLRRWYYRNSAPVPVSITQLIHNPGLLPMEDLVDWYISIKGKIRRKQSYILFSLIFRYYSLHSNHLFQTEGSRGIYAVISVWFRNEFCSRSLCCTQHSLWIKLTKKTHSRCLPWCLNSKWMFSSK